MAVIIVVSRKSSLLWAFVCVLATVLAIPVGGEDAAGSASVDAHNQYVEAQELKAFESYKDVQVFHFTIPTETKLASWELVANGSRHCNPKPVSFYLQHGSFPIANPENSSFPRFVTLQHPTLQVIELKSDSQTYYFDLGTPLPGDWFAIAFVHEDTERIVQKGLFFPCRVWLASTLKIQREGSVVTTAPGFEMQMRQGAEFQYYKFFAGENAQRASVSVQKCSRMVVTQDGLPECPLFVHARPLALPASNASSSPKQVSVNCSSQYDPTAGCRLESVPVAEGWNYVMVETSANVEYKVVVVTEICENGDRKTELVAANLSEFAAEMKDKLRFLMNDSGVDASPEALRLMQPSSSSSCPAQQTLVRNTLPGNFRFEYVYPPDENGSIPVMFNVTNNMVTRFRFRILPVTDVGGTLAVELALSPFTNTTVHNVSVTGCLEHDVVPVPKVRGSRGGCDSNMTVHVNTSSLSSMVSAILVPFPEAGNWYLSLEAECYFHEYENNESEVISVQCETVNTSIILRIKSAPCILGQCSNSGHCYQYVSSGFLFSSCSCVAGWRGWGCTDGSAAYSDTQLLVAVFLLTLSNIFFVPTIILALYRQYYTEALVYITTMLFSTFYHACDAEVYSFCLLRLSVLQFCDFYSAILSFWVTMMAMADLPDTLRSLVHVGGAIGLALGVEYDRTGLWVFLTPVSIGILILSVSWVIRCHQQRSCFPRRKTWLLCLVPGGILVAVGLVVFAFLETRENYAFTHSAWHVSMALSVVFLLPQRRCRKGRDDDEAHNACSYIRIEELSDISPSTEYGIHDHLLPPSPSP